MRYDLSLPFNFADVDIDELQEAMDANDPSALYVAGVMFFEGFNKVKIAQTTAYHAIEAGHASGDPLCTALVAVMQNSNQGVLGMQDRARITIKPVLPWILEQAEAGHPQVQRILGRMHQDGLGVKRDANLSVSWYRKASDNGDIIAMDALGSALAKTNSDQFLDCYQKAAETGMATAQLNFGTALCERKKQYAEGIAWTERSADQGNIPAMLQLGNIYMGVFKPAIPKDDEKAFEWHKKAADLGRKKSQIHVAGFYMNGIGVARNRAEALGMYHDLSKRTGKSWEDEALTAIEAKDVVDRIRMLKMAAAKPTKEEIDGVTYTVYAFDDGAKIDGEKPVLHVVKIADPRPDPHGHQAKPKGGKPKR